MQQAIHFCSGRFCSTDQLAVHPHNLGFLRAYGVFDFAPVYRGIPFRLNEHLDRLLESAASVGMECPYSLAKLHEITSHLIERNGAITGGFRYILSGGQYLSDTLIPERGTELLILAEPSCEKGSEGIRVTTSNVMRTLPHVKTTNYLPAVLGMKKAKSSGCDDALYVNTQGELLEGMTSNLFFVKDGKLFTDDSDQIIKGVTRSALLEVARGFIEVELRPIVLGELPLCEEAFLTSSTKDLLPVLQIDGQQIGKGVQGPVTRELRSRFLKLRSGELGSHELAASKI